MYYYDTVIKWIKFKDMTTWKRLAIPIGTRVLYQGGIYKLSANYLFTIVLSHDSMGDVTIIDSEFTLHSVLEMEFELRIQPSTQEEKKENNSEQKQETILERNERLEKEFIEFLFSHNQWGLR